MNDGEIYIYADNTTIYTIGITVDEISLVLQEGMDQLQTWCLNNRLIVHEGKSESMILSIISFIGPIRPLMWGEKVIQYKPSSVCLGVSFDEKLSWSQRIKSVCLSFNTKIKVLRRISFLKSILESIYFKTVIPSILYGVVVYGSSPYFKEL